MSINLYSAVVVYLSTIRYLRPLLTSRIWGLKGAFRPPLMGSLLYRRVERSRKLLSKNLSPLSLFSNFNFVFDLVFILVNLSLDL